MAQKHKNPGNFRNNPARARAAGREGARIRNLNRNRRRHAERSDNEELLSSM